ncbi:MAG: hypothetical protein M1426_05990 [Patescibacteria group bacterium]|nr:hypothetical protein [Patescibacteria group bacterium]
MKLTELSKKGFLQALGVTLYCSLVGVMFWKGNEFIGNPGYIGPVMFLVLFIVSALICALIVFYQPYILFFGGKKKEALDLVLSTTGWLFGFFILFLFSAAFVW